MPPKKPAPSGAAAEPAEVEADAEPVKEMVSFKWFPLLCREN